jgi:hypothetical protein
VDVAYDYNAGLMWIRVGGGDWNNDPTGLISGTPSDPATGDGGLSFSDPFTSSKFARPAASILSTGSSQISLKITSTFTVPSGYTFIY